MPGKLALIVSTSKHELEASIRQQNSTLQFAELRSQFAVPVDRCWMFHRTPTAHGSVRHRCTGRIYHWRIKTRTQQHNHIGWLNTEHISCISSYSEHVQCDSAMLINSYITAAMDNCTHLQLFKVHTGLKNILTVPLRFFSTQVAKIRFKPIN